MPVVRMRRSTRVFSARVLRSGRRVLTAQLGEVEKKRAKRAPTRVMAKVEKVLINESGQEATPLKDNGRHDEGFDLNREKADMDFDEDITEELAKETEKTQGAVNERRDKMIKDGSPLSYKFGSSSVQKRRSLRLRRAKISSPFVTWNANGALPSDLSVGHDNIQCSPLESGQQAISPVAENSITNVKKLKSSFAGLRDNIDTSACCADILVIELDRCYREEGAVINLVKSDSSQWFVAIEKDGTRRYTIMAQQVMRPRTFNRITHAIIWTCDNGWRLEFPNKRDWLIFKELYGECAEHNIQAPRVSVIPVPGVREVPSYFHSSRVFFKRPRSYITWKDDELTRALAKGTANYDLDCDDELWLDKFNNEYFQDDRINKRLSAAAFEHIINSFEKGFYCRQDDYSDLRVAIDLSLNLERREVLEAVHNYWMRKREQKKSPLARVFQGLFKLLPVIATINYIQTIGERSTDTKSVLLGCYQPRETHISPAVILRKQRSSNRQAGKSGRGQQ